MPPRAKPPSNAPSWAARFWFDNEFLYWELACGLITKAPFTEGALSKALKTMRSEHKALASPLVNGKSKEKLPIAVKRKSPEKSTSAETEAALEFLRKKGHLP